MNNVTILGGQGLLKAEIEEMWPEGHPVREALLSGMSEADLARVADPCHGCGCPDCQEKAAAEAAEADAENEGAPALPH